MKHKLLTKQRIDNIYLYLEIELIPENYLEKFAIKKVEAADADEEQKSLIENYLMFELNIPYSIISIEQQLNTHFTLKATFN